MAVVFIWREIVISILRIASNSIASFERWMLIILASSVTLLILLNVVTRSVDFAIYWVDELAIYAMVWMVMIGASVTIQKRQGISVTILEGILGERLWGVFLLIVDLIIAAFCIVLIWLSWIWYDPFTLISVGFDTDAFSSKTFNYIYDEPTLTIGLPKYVIWLVMPLTAVTMTVHAINNLVDRVNSKAEK